MGFTLIILDCNAWKGLNIVLSQIVIAELVGGNLVVQVFCKCNKLKFLGLSWTLNSENAGTIWFLDEIFLSTVHKKGQQ